ncbi:MAG: hypothetical protein KO206_04300 [Methanomicrobiaceae archaeon]|uniref:Uncharacterized protein n=1 Tax=hydrocarbon metagenome TaxID=938273 RepID=A0A0W8FEL1_9ZZZZ|nr:hypothetical protein [Methanomicrobiaceae archaeon]MDD5420110.1 hypothetical protein [Methanomicrobiaceae archaeon]
MYVLPALEAVDGCVHRSVRSSPGVRTIEEEIDCTLALPHDVIRISRPQPRLPSAVE